MKPKSFFTLSVSLTQKAWNCFLEALFPPRCIISNKEGVYLEKKFRDFPQAPESNAQFKYLDDIYAHTAYYDPVVEKVVEYFKFKGFKQLAQIMVQNIPKKTPTHFYPPLDKVNCANSTRENPLGDMGELEGVSQNIALVPIPLHWTRKLYRGFNQAEVLAKEIERKKGGKIEELKILNNLKRIKKTSQQARLSKFDRHQNLQNAFIWKQKKNASHLSISQSTPPIPHTIILIDDVVASGTTLDQAAKACKEAGVKQVYAIVFARGGKN